MYPKLTTLFALSALLLTLGACSHAEKTKPHLTANMELLKQHAPLFGKFIDQINSFPLEGQVGQDLVSNQDGFINDGKAFDVLKVTVRGKAFTDGYFGPPKGCIVETRTKASDSVRDKSSASFWENTPGVYVAVIPITCKDSVNLQIKIPCIKVGESEFEVEVGPKDESAPPLNFQHPCDVIKRGGLMKLLEGELSERHSSRERHSSSTATDDKEGKEDKEPKTQYELQQQMLKQQQEKEADEKDY